MYFSVNKRVKEAITGLSHLTLKLAEYEELSRAICQRRSAHTNLIANYHKDVDCIVHRIDELGQQNGYLQAPLTLFTASTYHDDILLEII